MTEGVALAKLYEIHIELYMVETRDITAKQTENSSTAEYNAIHQQS